MVDQLWLQYCTLDYTTVVSTKISLVSNYITSLKLNILNIVFQM